jgi:Domain of unknown function (DUF4432)
MSFETTIHLQPAFFSEREKPLAEFGTLKASGFLYSSGVHAVQLDNGLGEVVMLPFHGQQIWNLEFFGRNLTMKSMFPEPRDTRVYLENYGAFLIHCGATAMGVPAAGDTHPLHGELTHAPYQTAQLLIGQDDRGPYMGVTGTYDHAVAFGPHYVARPLVKLYANSSRVHVSLEIENLNRTPMELMYMAHANFRPVDDARLEYSAKVSPEHVRVRSSIPSHVKPTPEYLAFLERLSKDPASHHVLRPDLAFDPEVVFYIDYLADAHGWAHAMQVLPDGSADFISHQPAQLRKGVRWISRTPNQDCFGLNLPATAEPEGYTAEKAKGNVMLLEPLTTWRMDLEVGALEKNQAEKMSSEIARIVT